MPWSMTPVVPAVLRPPMLPSRGVESLGHHGRCSLTGLDPFTHDALRPAHSLSTLRRLPRDSPRKTRYSEGLGGAPRMAISRFIPFSTDGTCTRWLMSTLPGTPAPHVQRRWLCGQVRPVRLSATLCPSSHPAASHSARPTRRPAVARLRPRARPPRSGSISLLDPGSSPAASRTVVPRYGGTYAERNIAFEFYFWLSPDCELYLINEF